MELSPEIDLNLLRTFVLIYESRSLTRAAQGLHVSQPAVSHALGRLRRALGDPLFVRAAGGLRPTPVGLELFELVRGPLQLIGDAIGGGLRFDPAASTRTFSIALTDLGAQGLLPKIVAAAARSAPEVSFDVHPVEIDTVSGALVTGSLDAAIVSAPVPGPLRSEVLFGDRYGCLVRDDFPQSAGRVDETAFRRAAHAVVAADTGHAHVQRALSARGMPIRTGVTVRSFASLPPLVAECGLIAIVPIEGFAPFVSGPPLRIVELPIDIPGTDVLLHWSGQAAASPARAWLIETMRAALTR